MDAGEPGTRQPGDERERADIRLGFGSEHVEGVLLRNRIFWLRASRNVVMCPLLGLG